MSNKTRIIIKTLALTPLAFIILVIRPILPLSDIQVIFLQLMLLAIQIICVLLYKYKL